MSGQRSWERPIGHTQILAPIFVVRAIRIVRHVRGGPPRSVSAIIEGQNVVAFGLYHPEGLHFLKFVRFGGRKIFRLTVILLQIVKLPLIILYWIVAGI